MTVSFYVARIDEVSPVGFCPGWGVIRDETGVPARFVSRIFSREGDAQAHARRLMMQEAREAHSMPPDSYPAN
jgi:hypothetical protein